MRRILVSVVALAALTPVAVLAMLTPATARALPAAATARAVPAAATARTLSAHSGDVTATFRYAGSLGRYRDETLTITRAGAVVYRAPVTYAGCLDHSCAPSPDPRQPPVQVADLGRTGPPEVLVNLFTGGAHCCSVVQVFADSPARHAYVKAAQRNFGDPGYMLRRLGGSAAFVTADDAFAYAFTDFAASGLPLEILRYDGGRFSDVTRADPSLVRRDAARWLSAYRRQARSRWSDSVGLIAAWAADEYTLGRSRQAVRYLDAQARAGHLNSALNRSQRGMRFVANLEAFLLRHGYGRRLT